ncbi:MAG TPA: amylo-alpha-1,6-glucosidase [Candidatus Dormibacteraeota bacterium]|nr:amylo-alpha-1,6-glucosidase [Candidatus Dormibacteraeota bacterium]
MVSEPARPSVVSRVGWRGGDRPEALVHREWLVTNGLGGYASGTLAGVVTRRYHGLLVAALPVPQGRLVMLSRMDDAVVVEHGEICPLSASDASAGAPSPLDGFRLDRGIPIWTFTFGDQVLEKRVVMPYGQNTTHIIYNRVSGTGALRLRLSPAMQVRRLEDPVSVPIAEPYALRSTEDRHEIGIRTGVRPLRVSLFGGATAVSGDAHTERQFYALEAARGYDSVGELWSPGEFEVEFDSAGMAAVVASTEAWEVARALTPAAALAAEEQRRNGVLTMASREADHEPAAELTLAADQFLITPAGRVEEAARARAEGDELRTVIAGYHWFTDWGRDTMISLEGLALVTGRPREAAWILRTFARYVRHGLIPNLFPEGHAHGLYHTADATLWYFHALHRYVATTGDRRTLAAILPVLHDIVAWHVRGTDFNIGVDPADGLLRQGQEGYQLTWMDAKVGDWVVTPRRGKAVELQGLWYNALRLLETWVREEGDGASAAEYAAHARRTRESFNRRFWSASEGYLLDVADGEHGDDTSCRPNQLLAFSLEHPVLERRYWAPVLTVVTERLRTPVGLRSLAPGSPGYQPTYDGDLRARDAAYHQGTVWAWLIGPYICAWRRVHGDSADVAPLLAGLLAGLHDVCIGQLSEICDAEAPFRARGCVAQAWSVAEVLRCLASARGEREVDVGRS